MAEVAVNLQQPLLDTDVEDAAEDGLQIPAPRQQHSEAIAYGRFHAAEDGLQIPAPRQQHSEAIAHGRTKADYVDEEQSENTVYLDENGGAVEDLGLDMQKIVNAIQSHAISNGKAEGAIANREETGRGSESIEEEEVVEEEVVEVEFQNAIPKLHTHTMHCPNCNSHITKVVLRRKIIKQRPAPQITEVPPEPVDLLGCLSCFSLFTSAGNGSFNPSPLWRTTPASSTGVQPAGNEVEVPDEQGSNCFSTIRLLWKPSVSVNDPDKEDQSGVIIRTPPPKNSRPIGLLPGHLGGGKPETSIDIPVDSSPVILGQSQISSLGQDSKSFEILKSIVYGGLMEVIASLSIVASAAAADATTLSILSLALANLIGGIFIIGHNLWDLRNDCYRLSNEQTTEQTRTKYKELLGQIENFPLHMFFATLSFFVFGIIPPVAYGYAFYETSDKEFTLLVVLGVSVVCVSLLATFKAYVDRCDGFWGYVKTILYYVLSVVMVSGVSYAIGDLVTRVIEKLGLFETTGGADLAKLSNMVSTNTGFALY